jgi:hypothetical protein
VHRPLVLAMIGLAAPLLVACGGDEPSAAPAPAPEADDHGEIAGAVELDEPAVGLTTVDARGVVRHLDLLEEDVTELAGLDEPTGPVHTDGRFVFVPTANGVEVVDSGVWTWDHVDHFHYYRAEARPVGLVEGDGPATVATTASSTSGGTGVYLAGSGDAVLLDTEALADGELVELFRLTTTPHDGMAVPVGEHTLITEPDAAGRVARVVAHDREGTPGEAYSCVEASGTITTRVGTVVGCRDGALLSYIEDDELVVERIPYPGRPDAPPATAFAGRDGRPTVAALADERRVWLLDTRERSWSLLESPVPLADVTAVDDDDEHVVGLSTDGRVVVLSGESGELLGTSQPLAARSLRTGRGQPALVVDQQRAYLSAPVERRLLEIDFADGARVARTFDTPTEPLLTAGTGR